MYHNVSGKMEYIQKVFLGVQDFMQKNHELEELIAFLDTEPTEFRSVSYESASMEIGWQEISAGKELNNWKTFYQRSAKAHTFHMDIGLGWAFAKTGISPTPYLKSLLPVMTEMVFDGMGYYNGLFRGRKTVKNQLIPDGINEQEIFGFDQGLGRRLWYIAKGEVNELMLLLQPFPLYRRANLWRGLGIACGYVGGCDKSKLEQLLNASSEYSDQFRKGIALAALSRCASHSITADIELACEIACGKPFIDVLPIEIALINQFK